MSFTKTSGLLMLLLITLGISNAMFPLIGNNTTTGIIINDSTQNKIPFAHIYNESKRLGAISNSMGQFSIMATPGDTLVVSSIGYYAKVVFVPDTSNFIVTLKARQYKIDEVTIKIFRDYEHFKREFIALELPETETERIQKQINKMLQKEILLAENDRNIERRQLTPALGPELPMSVPLLSRQERQLINLAEVLQQEKKQRVIDKKYNRDIVRKVTNLPNDEVLDFMIFCNFNPDILYHASEYDIAVMIERKYKEYIAHKTKGALQENCCQGLCLS